MATIYTLASALFTQARAVEDLSDLTLECSILRNLSKVCRRPCSGNEDRQSRRSRWAICEWISSRCCCLQKSKGIRDSFPLILFNAAWWKTSTDSFDRLQIVNAVCRRMYPSEIGKISFSLVQSCLEGTRVLILTSNQPHFIQIQKQVFVWNGGEVILGSRGLMSARVSDIRSSCKLYPQISFSEMRAPSSNTPDTKRVVSRPLEALTIRYLARAQIFRTASFLKHPHTSHQTV